MHSSIWHSRDTQSRSIFEHLCLFCYWQCCNFHFRLTAVQRKLSFSLPKLLIQEGFFASVSTHYHGLVSNLYSILLCLISLLFPAFLTAAFSFCYLLQGLENFIQHPLYLCHLKAIITQYFSLS